jgi:serine/threonine protein kinase/WD40 repeat protein
MSARSSRIKELFGAALDLPPQQWQRFLADRCGGDTELTAELIALLQAHLSAGRFLDPGEDSFSSPVDSVPSGEKLDRFEWLLFDEQPGSTIDRYKLLEVIGEGGHGIVFRAEQEQPVRRVVALKVIRKGMETSSARARFDAERQTLALMDHPNIAKLFDAGTTEQGRPYLVMELVPGIPVTRFCDDQRLSIRRRVELMITICRAVQHAHQKGIIHQDLKPSNILVRQADGNAEAKVIDFGVSRALSQDASPTDRPQIIGTPQYMSPELSGDAVVDTRTDVYALGAVLYELLAGVPAIELNRQRLRTLADLQELFNTAAPIAPSKRLLIVLSKERVTELAERRSTTPARLVDLLREDLDSTVLKAIHRNRAQRYDSAAALADDLQRHLDGQPVLAVPGNWFYLFRKFSRRNQTAVIFSLAIAVGLVLSLWAVTAALIQTRAARDKAFAAEQASIRSKNDALAKLLDSYLQQAKVGERSRWPGQRTDSLRVIALAAQISPSMELRNQAIACMSLPDVEIIEKWDTPPSETIMSFSRKFDCYAVCNHDGSVGVFRTSDRSPLGVLPGTGKRLVGRVVFSPDGKFIAAKYRTVPPSTRIWELSSRQCVFEIDSIHGIAFSHDSRRFAVSTDAGSVDLYSLPAVQKTQSLYAGGTLRQICFSPDDGRIAEVPSQGGAPSIVRLGGTSAPLQIPTEFTTVMTLAWNPSGQEVAIGGFDRLNRVEVFSSQTGKLHQIMTGHGAPVVDLAYTADGRLLFTGGWDARLRCWEAVTGSEAFSLEGYSGGVQISPDETRLALGTGSQHQIWRLIRSDECRLIAGELEDNSLWSSDISPGGTLLAAAGAIGVRIWNVATGKQCAFLEAPGPRTVLFSPDGKRLLASTASGVMQWNVADIGTRMDDIVKAQAELVNESVTPAMDTNGDWTRIVFGDTSGLLRVGDPAHLDAALPLGEHFPPPRFIAVSPNGAWAASSTRFGSMFKVWNLASRTLAAELPLSDKMIEAGPVAFSPDGKILMTSDHSAYHWYHVGDWKPFRVTPRQHSDMAGCICFSPDGKVVALEGPAYSTTLVDAATGDELATLDTQLPHFPAAVRFSPDSRLLQVVTNHSVILWDLPLLRRNLKAMRLDWN